MHSLERFAKEYYQEALEKGIEQGIEQGIERGIEQNREQELVSAAKIQVGKKYKIEILSDELSDLIEKANIDALAKFRELIFDFENVKDVVEYFKSNQRENKYNSEDEKFEAKNKLNEELSQK